MDNDSEVLDEIKRQLADIAAMIKLIEEKRSFNPQVYPEDKSEDQLLTEIMDDADREAEMLARKRAEEERQARYEANTHNLLPFAQFLSNRGLIDEEPADIIAHYADVCEIRYQRGL